MYFSYLFVAVAQDTAMLRAMLQSGSQQSALLVLCCQLDEDDSTIPLSRKELIVEALGGTNVSPAVIAVVTGHAS